MPHLRAILVALLEVSSLGIFSQVVGATAEKNASAVVPVLYLFNQFGEPVETDGESVPDAPARALRAYLADAAEKYLFAVNQKNEQARPIFTGAESLSMGYGEKLSLAKIVAKTADGKALPIKLASEFDGKKLGAQNVVVKACDEKKATQRCKVVTVQVVDKTAPKLTVAKAELSTVQGQAIDVMAGVKAVDVETGNLTQHVTHSAVDFNKVGKQVIIYSVKDGSRHETSARAELTVKKNPKKVATQSETVVGSQNNVARGTVATGGTSTSYAPNKIYFSSSSVTYINGGAMIGQALIDRNQNGIASSYYGKSFNGTDGAFTHFIGHYTGAFAPVLSLGIGSSVTVTDANAQPFTYHVYKVLDIPTSPGGDGMTYPTTDAGMDLVDDLYYNRIAGEKIIFQTCVTPSGSLTKFVFAQK